MTSSHVKIERASRGVVELAVQLLARRRVAQRHDPLVERQRQHAPERQHLVEHEGRLEREVDALDVDHEHRVDAVAFALRLFDEIERDRAMRRGWRESA